MQRGIAEYIGCRKFRRVILALVILGTVIGLVRFGNTQWCRYIYIAQAYYTPGAEDGMLYPPSDYTGVWIMWAKNGQILAKLHFRNGILCGESELWSGISISEKLLQYVWHPQHSGVIKQRSQTGHLLGITSYRNGVRSGRKAVFHPSGTLISEEYYLNDKEVTRSEYLAACAKDPTLPKPPDEDVEKSHPTTDADPKDNRNEKMTEPPGDAE